VHASWIKVGQDLGSVYAKFELEWLSKGVIKVILKDRLSNLSAQGDMKVGSF
jgi:hypothetical protein